MKSKLIKFLIIGSFISSFGFNANGNPSGPYTLISEIYFNASGDWTIEFMPTEWGTFDNFRLTGLYDTALFLPGINCNEVTLITQGDFSSPLYLSQAGDFISLELFIDNTWYVYGAGLAYGNLPDSCESGVSAPVGEESICYLRTGGGGHGSPYYFTAKELPNSLGENVFNVLLREDASGYVFDTAGYPQAGITIKFSNLFTTVTDDNGYFYIDSIYCKKYDIEFISPLEEPIGYSEIFIEPDSANYFEMILDGSFVGLSDTKPEKGLFMIRNFPNPFTGQTRFVIDGPATYYNHKGVIKIYNSEGIIVDILPVELSGNKQELIYNPANLAASGLYYYVLEIGHRKLATGKMVISI